MKWMLFLIGFCICQLANRQRVNQCGIIVPPKSLQSNFQSVYEARAFINAMLDKINWKQNFNLQ